jgi:hypothetical protein
MAGLAARRPTHRADALRFRPLMERLDYNPLFRAREVD